MSEGTGVQIPPLPSTGPHSPGSSSAPEGTAHGRPGPSVAEVFTL